MPKLKAYEKNQELKTIREAPESSGVACTEPKCPGELMISVPHQVHYSVGRAGEPGAIKSGLVRAACGECDWRGWV